MVEITLNLFITHGFAQSEWEKDPGQWKCGRSWHSLWVPGCAAQT